MTYEEFDKKYNTRRCGIIDRCSIITLEGQVICEDEIENIEEFWDNKTEAIFKNSRYSHQEFNGQEVVMTNVSRSGRYSDYFFNKLLFKVVQ